MEGGAKKTEEEEMIPFIMIARRPICGKKKEA